MRLDIVYTYLMKLPVGRPRVLDLSTITDEKRRKHITYMREWYQRTKKKRVQQSLDWKRANRDKVNIYQNAYFKHRFRSDPEFRERQRLRGLKKYRKFRAQYLLRCARLKHTLTSKARQKLNDAVRHKRIIRPSTCEACGVKEKIQGHHHRGYKRPLDVLWLCKLCHESL